MEFNFTNFTNKGINLTVNPLTTTSSATNSLIEIKRNRRATYLGCDSEGNMYYSIFCNQDCRIYKEKKNKELQLEFYIAIHNYDELEKFLTSFDGTRNINEVNLIKKIKEYLLKYKEFDDQEKIREINFGRKIQHQEKLLKMAYNKVNFF